jgi:Zn-dependent peptidase ImmA (M78 family)
LTYHPYRALAALEHVTLVITRLPKGAAWWLPCEQAIVLDDRLSRVERRCATAHEIEHAVENDQPIRGHLFFSKKQERRATRRSTKKLIPLDQLVDALLWSRRECEVADALDVTVEALQQRLALMTPAEHRYVDERIWAAEDALHT